MSAVVQRAELGNGRVLTFVATVSETSDDAPRVYLGARTELVDIDAEPGRKFTVYPTIEVAENLYSLDAAEELARRLMVGAAYQRLVCSCGHPFWQHHDGGSCGEYNADTFVVCRCARFTHQLVEAL